MADAVGVSLLQRSPLLDWLKWEPSGNRLAAVYLVSQPSARADIPKGCTPPPSVSQAGCDSYAMQLARWQPSVSQRRPGMQLFATSVFQRLLESEADTPSQHGARGPPFPLEGTPLEGTKNGKEGRRWPRFPGLQVKYICSGEPPPSAGSFFGRKGCHLKKILGLRAADSCKCELSGEKGMRSRGCHLETSAAMFVHKQCNVMNPEHGWFLFGNKTVHPEGKRQEHLAMAEALESAARPGRSCMPATQLALARINIG